MYEIMQIILGQYDQIASLKGCIVRLVEFLQLFSRVSFHICPQVTNIRRCILNTHVVGDYNVDGQEGEDDDDDGDDLTRWMPAMAKMTTMMMTVTMMAVLEKNQNLRKLFNALPRVQREQI